MCMEKNLMRPFHFINVTWGPRHTGLFLDVSLPTQLAPGNLPALANRAGTIYKIYTTHEDAKRIRESPVYQKLCQTVTTEIILIEVNPETPHHLMFAEFHKLAIMAAEKVEAALVFLAPDTLLSNGSFARLGELVDSGKRAVFTSGIRLTLETFVPAFHERYRAQGQDRVCMTGRELVDLALDHVHPFSEAVIWPARIPVPSNLFWSVGREGLIGRCFHLHPIVIVASPLTASFSSTIDGDYLELACPRGAHTHVICDSDEFCIFEISPKSYMLGLTPSEPIDHRGIARWALLYANRVHRQLVKSSIRIHRGECSKAWDKVQAKSDEDVRKSLLFLRIYVWCVFLGGGAIVLPLLRKPFRMARSLLRPYKPAIVGLLKLPVRILRQTGKFAKYLTVRVARRTAKAVLGLFVDNPREFVSDSAQSMKKWGRRLGKAIISPRKALSRLALEIRGQSNKLPRRDTNEAASIAAASTSSGNRTAAAVQASEVFRFDSPQAQIPSRDVRVPASVKS